MAGKGKRHEAPSIREFIGRNVEFTITDNLREIVILLDVSEYRFSKKRREPGVKIQRPCGEVRYVPLHRVTML